VLGLRLGLGLGFLRFEIRRNGTRRNGKEQQIWFSVVFRPQNLGLQYMLLLLCFLRFYVFLKIQKNVTFYVFVPCFTRFLELWLPVDFIMHEYLHIFSYVTWGPWATWGPWPGYGGSFYRLWFQCPTATEKARSLPGGS